MAHSLKNFYRDHMNLEVEVIEQDQILCDTLATQGKLYHSSLSDTGPDLIIISRCNINLVNIKNIST